MWSVGLICNFFIVASLPVVSPLVARPPVAAPSTTSNQHTVLFDGRVAAAVGGFCFCPPSTKRFSFSSDANTNPIMLRMGSKTEPEVPQIPDVTVEPSYDLALGSVILGYGGLVALPASWCSGPNLDVLICPPSISGVFLFFLFSIFGSLCAVQAYRIRFIFDETSFQLKFVTNPALPVGSASDGGPPILREGGENIVVGDANKWPYDKIVNWEFFPSVALPVLVYFKETQTSSKLWNEGPGQFDKVGGGQIHFFPAVCNTKQLKEQFEVRGCSKVKKN